MQPYLSEKTVNVCLSELDMHHYVADIVSVDNFTMAGKRSFVLSVLVEDRATEPDEEKLARRLSSILREKGFLDGMLFTIRRLDLMPAPRSNTGP